MAAPRRPVRTLNLLSGNAGGLSTGIYQELLAWVDIQKKFQMIVIQETHWSQTSDYQSGEWLCMHSSGQGLPEGRDSHSGLPVLISRRHFMDPCLVEHVPGRLLQIQAVLRATMLPITIVAVYQHVWRTHLPTAENHKLRNAIWHKLSDVLTKTPLRDMNSTLKPQSPHVGPASTPSDAYNHSTESLIADHDLCVLNSWHCTLSNTYHSTGGAGQIDFVLTRRGEAFGPAKLAGHLTSFPIGAWRDTGHYPVQASLPFLPYGSKSLRQLADRPALDAIALQNSVQSQDAKAELLRIKVVAALSDIPADLALVPLRDAVNVALLSLAGEVFPPSVRPDNRVCVQDSFRASAKLAWSLYRQAKRPGPRSLQRLLQPGTLQKGLAGFADELN